MTSKSTRRPSRGSASDLAQGNDICAVTCYFDAEAFRAARAAGERQGLDFEEVLRTIIELGLEEFIHQQKH
jgi:hypothetical protein